jgi:chromosome segregation ATPase
MAESPQLTPNQMRQDLAQWKKNQPENIEHILSTLASTTRPNTHQWLDSMDNIKLSSSTEQALSKLSESRQDGAALDAKIASLLEDRKQVQTTLDQINKPA